MVGVVFVLLHATHVAVGAARAARRTVVRAGPQPTLSTRTHRHTHIDVCIDYLTLVTQSHAATVCTHLCLAYIGWRLTD